MSPYVHTTSLNMFSGAGVVSKMQIIGVKVKQLQSWPKKVVAYKKWCRWLLGVAYMLKESPPPTRRTMHTNEVLPKQTVRLDTNSRTLHEGVYKKLYIINICCVVFFISVVRAAIGTMYRSFYLLFIHNFTD